MTDSLMPERMFYGSVRDALALDDKWMTKSVLVNGEPVDNVRLRIQHGYGSPVATCEMEIASEDLPLFPLGASIEVQAGYGSAVGTRFVGALYEDFVITSDQGGWSRLLALGHGHRLTYGARRDIVFPAGPIAPLAIFKALCSMRGIPNYYGEDVLDASNNPIMLGGVAGVDDGQVIIPKDTNLLSWMNSKFGLFEYWVGDQPDGSFQLMRMLMPPANPEEVVEYEEAQHALVIERSRRATEIYNDWLIEGASWRDPDTEEEFLIRSFPVSPPVEPLLPPLMYQHRELRDSILVTQELADAARNAKEIRYGALTPDWSIDAEGDPTLQIGATVRVIRPSSGDDDLVLATDITETIDDAGYWMTVEARAGNGSPQPRGDDCITVPLLTGTIHLGDEYLPNYRVPSANGNAGRFLHKIDFMVPEEYTSLKVVGFWHGCNNLLSGEITASRFEIHQGSPLGKVADGMLPRQPESLTIRYGAGYDHNWTEGTVVLKGRLKAVPAQLWIVSGQNDDFEVRDLKLIGCGVGSPIYPVEE